ncbi:Uncharacterised protein [[Clostridium] sordellii]|uniref:hypothetical protein n=1 Tax=Paraclostridium sordellii TaxID=1505 RepID=UPI0005DDBEB0|nr:hypothetical protein [Paeniclostridium sordellii]CEQ01666.1 Uncharacterised protein [[Clostridium] sordellii] [Paeniclostridium sordellii]
MENFKIECLNCGSRDVSVKEDFDWGWDGEDEYLTTNGYYVMCNKCDNTENI